MYVCECNCVCVCVTVCVCVCMYVCVCVFQKTHNPQTQWTAPLQSPGESGARWISHWVEIEFIESAVHSVTRDVIVILPTSLADPCNRREREREIERERERERERNVLFNDALNTFYLRLYGVRHMVKDHSDSEKGNPLPPHRLLLSINSCGSFICTIPQTGYHIPRPLLHQLWSTGWNEK